ncbi:MAG: NADPH-dependent 7-cyano-7-deazaguanine reductase QueF [Synechococcaceae cyanobacterium RL_1_2]|nr:NADPH-dependent 7-cyano-7-deazaguanine reductase QueF [Synechococcaceae cyanobacterium RL_1_2]
MTVYENKNNQNDNNDPSEKYGEREIEEGKLITFPNPRPGRYYTIEITLPEYTCKCPFSGYPDFATIYVSYVPDQKVVELKTVKLYINGYRDRYISHEEAVNQILDDLVAACDPLEMEITGDYQPRGNVHTVVTVKYQQTDKEQASSGKTTKTKKPKAKKKA